MHSDRGRYTSHPTTYQSTIALEAADYSDHCFGYMSGSHKLHDLFFEEHPTLEMEPIAQEGCTQLSYTELKWFEERGCEWVKVPVGKGALVLWEDRLIHSTCPPLRGRQEPKPRYIIYGTVAPSSTMPENKRKKWARLMRAAKKDKEARQELQDMKKSCKGLRQVLP